MRLVFIALCLCHSLVASSTQSPGYQKPLHYQYKENSEALRDIAARYLPPNPVIVEAGAYDGSESATMAHLWPSGHIHSFEPIADLYRIVAEHTKAIPNITTYPLAIGEECGSRSIYLAFNPHEPTKICMSSSLYPPKDHTRYYGPIFQGTETIQMITLDAWAIEHQIEKVDMLWFDLQGYELSALKGAAHMLSNVSVIMTEVEFSELYEGQPLYREVKAWLENQGFVLIAGSFSFPKDPNQHFGDALFVRRELLQR